ncbi:hypothetical protein HanRHA438_Chr09g0418041 [Helianthus annuus]|uniref:Uncharacterized protein n=1 Tax=Helianthus annuus TaxID=4232 RepID=A0A251U1M6_HELAN|nr:uncharacterized protein LOC110879494 [Helianthus annuus]XP_021983646.1 uncharacterized protein LOC110879494 [Helianthus annuus]XP_035833736.1 uncharacterized protein LOC110879494 [Helianthus annuus]XP_035833737.1 uncharacterized protein LOC110879494 [Helianthus annuus]KAF5792443.1 hypothetical protein HanXRQr2_Chr09g0406041 [Helianthus annuus]KAJ0527384.1 hypothetical protein HanHA300_Chr09g0333421 [Helianthus annuus]KAJ0543786.1 hypothetical protein HanHA89_Chr09g0354401 [Helianthus annuu
MASVRLIRLARPPSAISTAPPLESVSAMRFTCMAAGFGSENTQLTADMERKPVALPKVATYTVADLDGAVVEVEPTQTISEGVDVATLMAFLTRRRQWNLIIQSLVEKIIVDSRFFTMFGVAGTLLGSVLCFLEGVFLVVESYFQYFHALYHHSNHGHIMDLLIKALDMFLVGTAMLTFGMGLYVMFVGSKAPKGRPIPSSNFFGLFHLKEFPSWAGIKSISQAKSKIGHALMLLLQVGVLEKFKSIPLVTGLDLACFAAAVFVSSAGLFILSRLSTGTNS